jgi:hypothetical protein
MSYKSTVVFERLLGGGELHVYDTLDPALTDGHTLQRRIGVLLPRSDHFEGLDYDEPLVPLAVKS